MAPPRVCWRRICRASKAREEQRAEQRLARLPGAEDDEGDADPAAAVDHLEEEGREGGERQEGAADRHQAAADHDGADAQRGDREALGLDGGGVLADGAEREAEGGAPEDEGGDGDGGEGDVGERGLGEDAGERQRREGLDARRRGHAREGDAVGVGGGGGGEQRDAEADDVLGEAEGHGEDAVQEAEGHAGEKGDGDPAPERKAGVDGEPAGEGADDHDALDAEVEHAGALADELAHGREDQRRGDADDGGPEADRGEDVEDGVIGRPGCAAGTRAPATSAGASGGSISGKRKAGGRAGGRGHPLRRRKRVSLRAATMVRSAVASRMSAM